MIPDRSIQPVGRTVELLPGAQRASGQRQTKQTRKSAIVGGDQHVEPIERCQPNNTARAAAGG
jgi:hypothetical protein